MFETLAVHQFPLGSENAKSFNISNCSEQDWYPSYMVSGTRDNPPPEATLSSVYMWKHRPCTIIRDPYLKIKSTDIPLSLSFSRSFDQNGFCRVNFHFFDTNFCFKSEI